MTAESVEALATVRQAGSFEWLIVLVYVVHFRAIVWAHEHLGGPARRWGAIAAVALAVVAHLVLATGLGWI